MRRLKILLVLFLSSVSLAGCFQEEQRLIVFPDGSGVWQDELVIPRGSPGLMPMLSDVELEKFLQNFDRDKLLKIIHETGSVPYFFLFEKRQETDGYHRDYIVSIDDVDKLAGTGLLGADISVNRQGDSWIVELGTTAQAAKELRKKLATVTAFLQSDKFKRLDVNEQEALLESLRGFRVELLVSLPFTVKEASGLFQKINETTVQALLEGDLTSEEEVARIVNAVPHQPSRGVWDAKAPQMIDVNQLQGEEPSAMEPLDPFLGLPVVVTFKGKDRQAVKGILVDITQNELKFYVGTVTVTYYQDEIERLEPVEMKRPAAPTKRIVPPYEPPKKSFPSRRYQTDTPPGGP